MVANLFAHIDTWVFDLDNTLYPPTADLFGRMDPRFFAYIMRVTGVDADAAPALTKDLWQRHGSTLAGLMREHEVDPHHFLADVHDIDISHLTADTALAGAIGALPGRKIVFTNGSHNHAERVLQARGLTDQFDAVYGIEHAEFQAKPAKEAFATVFELAGLAPATAAMFEDEPRNLAVPHSLGMRTVHVHPTPHESDHIHHHTDDLTAFLSQLGR
ncbi:pyrimidine 5'-nucleotidase [Loktanella agnita]|uniref:pyrimidine 5'-nucleotidase n=1 Tax=Loktanella agnita TaxID=287097 RepID=UPI003987E262